MKVNTNQIVKNIANAIKNNPNKIEQLEKVKDITLHYTSDNNCRIVIEMYNNNIVRYIVNGTKSQTIVTYNTATKQIVRKPYKEIPWYTDFINCSINDILREVK